MYNKIHCTAFFTILCLFVIEKKHIEPEMLEAAEPTE